jgi:hypothetical protein
MTTNQRTKTMTTFHSLQSDSGRYARKMANVSGFQIHVMNCTTKSHVNFHEARKIVCHHFQRAVQVHITKLSFYTSQALPLVTTRFLRLANSSPKTGRSPARRSRDGREPSGKKSGEISRVVSVQRPGNSRTVATAMSPNVRASNSRDNSQYGTQQSGSVSVTLRANRQHNIP